MKTRLLFLLALLFVFSTWPVHAYQFTSAKIVVTATGNRKVINLPSTAILQDFTLGGHTDNSFYINSIEVQVDNPNDVRGSIVFYYNLYDGAFTPLATGDITLDRKSSTSNLWSFEEDFYNLFFLYDLLPGETYYMDFDVRESDGSPCYPANGEMNRFKFKVAPTGNFNFSSVSVGVTLNEETFTQNLPASGMNMIDATNELTTLFMVNGFSAQIANPQADVSEVSMMMDVYPAAGGDPVFGTIMRASNMGNGLWKVDGSGLNMLSRLVEYNKPYILKFFFKGKASTGEVFYFDNGGEKYSVKFIPAPPPSERFASVEVGFDFAKWTSSTLLEESMGVVDCQYVGDKFQLNGFIATITGAQQEMQSVSLIARIYPLEGGDFVREFRIDAANIESGVWLAVDKHINILESLEREKQYDLVLYIVGKNASGQKVYYNNEGKNYHFNFIYADPPKANVTINKATVRLLTDKGSRTYTYDEAGYEPNEQLWDVGRLILNDFTVELERLEGVEVDEVTLWYCVGDYYSGGDWHNVKAQRVENMDDPLKLRYSASNLGVNLLENCELFRNYNFNVHFSAVDSNGKEFNMNPLYSSIFFSPIQSSVRGDVNGDGAVTSIDIACLVNVLAGLDDANDYEGRADVTGDGGAVTAADIAAIVNILAGLD